jgi:hypothetical protein
MTNALHPVERVALLSKRMIGLRTTGCGYTENYRPLAIKACGEALREAYQDYGLLHRAEIHDGRALG